MDVLRGACDLHVHTGPAVFARLLTHLEAAEQACSVGMKAVVIKDHHSETASKATMVREFVPEVETFGGVVLNYAVGGLNPFAVDAAINYGAKIIFMPTTDSSNHMNHFGMEGATYARYHRVVSGRELSYRGREGITILTERGELLPEMEEILNLIAEADVAIATSHLGADEDVILVDEARKTGVDKIIITHANYWILELDIEKQVELAEKGAYIELAYSTLLPFDTRERTASMTQHVDTINRVGAERCLLSSDLGQPMNIAPVEGLRAFYATLMEKGNKKSDVKTMACTNPKKLLGLK